MAFILWSLLCDGVELSLCQYIRSKHYLIKYLVNHPDDYHYAHRSENMTYFIGCVLLIFLTFIDLSHPSLPFPVTVIIWLIDCIWPIALISFTNHSIKKSIAKGFYTGNSHSRVDHVKSSRQNFYKKN